MLIFSEVTADIVEECYWTLAGKLDHRSLTNLLIDAEQDNFYLIGTLIYVEKFSESVNNMYLS